MLSMRESIGNLIGGLIGDLLRDLARFFPQKRFFSLLGKNLPRLTVVKKERKTKDRNKRALTRKIFSKGLSWRLSYDFLKGRSIRKTKKANGRSTPKKSRSSWWANENCP